MIKPNSNQTVCTTENKQPCPDLVLSLAIKNQLQ